MKNPFKVGDLVYTVGNPTPWKVAYASEASWVRLGLCPENIPIDSLSFKPWPAPCHERHIEDGWWICTEKASRSPAPVIREVVNGQTEFPVGSTVVKTGLHLWDFHKYLGKDWK